MTTMLTHALALAAQGFFVFPLRPMSKKPLLDGDWKSHATRDPVRIREWWASYPAANIGIFTGKFGDNKALCVVDIDVKGEHSGFDTIVKLEMEDREFPPTMEAATPSGGRHLYYVVDRPLNQGGAGCIGPGVDLRSHGGYVVGPGSETKKGAYVWR